MAFLALDRAALFTHPHIHPDHFLMPPIDSSPHSPHTTSPPLNPPPPMPKLGQTRCCKLPPLYRRQSITLFPRLDPALRRARLSIRGPSAQLPSRPSGRRHHWQEAPRLCPSGRARQCQPGPRQGPREQNPPWLCDPVSSLRLLLLHALTAIQRALLAARAHPRPSGLHRRAQQVHRRRQGLIRRGLHGLRPRHQLGSGGSRIMLHPRSRRCASSITSRFDCSMVPRSITQTCPHRIMTSTTGHTGPTGAARRA
jgi:hypothetical protein